VHGSPVGISQAGVSNPLAERVALTRGARRTEIRNIPQTRSFDSRLAASFHGTETGGSMPNGGAGGAGGILCGLLRPQSIEWKLCMGILDIPGGDGGGNATPLDDPDCPIPLIRDADGQCRQPGSPADIDIGGSMAGQAVMGRYGAALAPMSDMRLTRDCLPGMVLGDDNLCYNRRDIRNRDRKWPRGTRPLGTPGEMNALRKAASFGRRMETTVKQMQKIGVLKKPSSRRAKAPPKQLVAGPGITAVSVGE